MSASHNSSAERLYETRSNLEMVADLGQSIWLDFIDRDLIESGRLHELVSRGVRGLTSNPAIFEQAMISTSLYDEGIRSAVSAGITSAPKIFERLAVADIRDAADILAPVFRSSDGSDGFVSLEVSPHLARNLEATISEARRLWREVNRPNLLIKVPGTPECLPAIELLISEGVNVNVTLLFSREIYRRVADAYLSGLERRLAKGRSIRSIASVASFFVSRIDVAVDKLLDTSLANADPTDARQSRRISSLKGKAGIANARLAYREFRQILQSPRWRKLADAGARPQRVLWASTGTKNPAYSDVLYVEGLIAPQTVDTVPMNTLEAFEDHGHPRLALSSFPERNELPMREAEKTLRALEHAGIHLNEVTDRLLLEGIDKFEEPYDKLMAALEKKRGIVFEHTAEEAAAAINEIQFEIPVPLEPLIEDVLEDWRSEDKNRRLWNGDPGLWTGKDENRWVGWLTVIDRGIERLPELEEFSAEVYNGGFLDAVVLGMGGSSLCPEVLAKTFRPAQGYPRLHVLDTTQPEQIRRLEHTLDLERTLFVVSSKSGTTLEPNLLMDYFYSLMKRAVGSERAARSFIVVTDPGTPLEKRAREEKFRRIFHGEPSIGGRYSALSDFGLVPAAILGMDLRKLLSRARAMAAACGPSVEPEDNPGTVLGAILGALALEGRDKITLFSSPEIGDLPVWLEQLLAESTGKNGKGLIPVAGEPLGSPSDYGEDRQFHYLRLEGGSNQELDARARALIAGGHPLVQIDIPSGEDRSAYGISQEFFRWEIATAVAGSILGIDPFDQPDVEAAKVGARELTAEFERSGTLPPEEPFYVDHGISLYADARNERELLEAAEDPPSLRDIVRAHINRLAPGDYLAILAFIDPLPKNERALTEIRALIRDSRQTATCLGFGPRFLHSTGQIYKGGPNSGVFIQLTSRSAHEHELPIPDHRYGFDIVQRAQARGDLGVLAQRGRRHLRIDFGTETEKGLQRLEKIIREITK